MVKYIVENNFVEIYFDRKPDEKIIDSIKIYEWWWNKYKKCWRNYKNNENIEFAKLICKELNPKEVSKLLHMKRTDITAENVVVRCNSFYCNLHHDVEDMAGEIMLYDKFGNIEVCLVPIAYCKTCDVYYMLEETYLALKSKKKVILAQIMTRKEYFQNGEYDDNYEKWKNKSPLKLWGYNVSQADGYSEKQRHMILEDIIDCGKMSKDRVMSYLDFFIRINKHKENLSVDKWKADRMYISDYKLGTAKRKKIGTITVVDRVYI